jgi:transposase InsO family protein
MPAVAKIPETEEEYKSIVLYLQSNILPPNAKESPQKKSNFIRRCKQFQVDEEILYTRPTNKNGRRRVLPKYDTKLRELVLNRFHDKSNHCEYHKTHSAIMEKHIGITQEEVRAYVNKCSACAINTSIKEKTDMTPVVSTEPWAHLQIDLIDFHEFVDENDGYAWLLTCVCTFSKFLVAVPMKNKEAATVAKHLINDVFKIPGPPQILQSDNGKEFVAEVVKNVCNILNIKIRHGRPRHPQSQGQVERLNQTIGRGFTKLLWDNNNQLQRKDWINVIDAFVMTYNSIVHSAHSRTPHQALFGWKMHCVYDSPDNNDINNGIDSIDNGNNDDDDNDDDNENNNNDNDNNSSNSSNSSSSNNNNNNDDNENNIIDDEPDSSEDAVKRHLSKVLQVHQSVNNTLDKYRSKVCQNGSVHRKKRASNTIEAGTSVYIAPDHDNNQRTRKRKLQPTYSETGTFKRLTSNNRTAVVVIDNKETRVPIIRVKPKHS